MRVAITGGAGFIGLAAAEALLDAGHDVLLLDLLPPPPAFLAHPALTGAEFATCDALDQRGLVDALRGFDADALLPFAALTPDGAVERMAADRVVAVNLAGLAAGIQAASAADVVRVVALSSVAVHGGRGPWAGPSLTEASMPQPDSLYGITKLSAESMARHLAGLHGLTLTILRLGPVFGPWERAGAARPDLSPHGQILSLSQAGIAPVLPHEMRADWLYSRDAAAGIMAALVAPATEGATFNLGAGGLSSPAQWAVAAGLPVPVIDANRANVTSRVVVGRPPLSTDAFAAASGFAGTRPIQLAALDHMSWAGQIDRQMKAFLP